MSAEHRKPLAAFVVLACAAASLVGVQRADAEHGRLLDAVGDVGGRIYPVPGLLPTPYPSDAQAPPVGVAEWGSAVEGVIDGTGTVPVLHTAATSFDRAVERTGVVSFGASTADEQGEGSSRRVVDGRGPTERPGQTQAPSRGVGQAQARARSTRQAQAPRRGAGKPKAHKREYRMSRARRKTTPSPRAGQRATLPRQRRS